MILIMNFYIFTCLQWSYFQQLEKTPVAALNTNENCRFRQASAGPGYLDVGNVGNTCSVSSSVPTAGDISPDTTWGSPTKQNNDSLFAFIRWDVLCYLSRGFTVTWWRAISAMLSDKYFWARHLRLLHSHNFMSCHERWRYFNVSLRNDFDELCRAELFCPRDWGTFDHKYFVKPAFGITVECWSKNLSPWLNFRKRS
jgi:hypothetical protein